MTDLAIGPGAHGWAFVAVAWLVPEFKRRKAHLVEHRGRKRAFSS